MILVTLFLLFCFCGNSGNTSGNKVDTDDLYTIKTKEIKETGKIEEKISILDEKPEIKVNIGIYKSSSAGILLLADALNFFEEQGVYPKFTLYPDYPSLVKAFKNKEVYIATIGLYKSLLLLLEGFEFSGVLPLSYKGITFAGHYRENLTNISSLKDKNIGFTEDTVDYMLLYKALNTAGLDFDDVKLYSMPKEVIKKSFDEGYIDAGFFTGLYHPPMKDINVILGPTRYNTYKIETLLISKDFVNDEKEAVELIINAYKKALLYYKQHKESALEIISDKNRLDIAPEKFEQILGYEPLIDITKSKTEEINQIETNEDTIRNKFFHKNGIYNKEANKILDFIVNNIDKYKKNEYEEKLKDIKLKLLRSRYFTVIYLASSGFNYEQVDKVKIDPSLKKNWNKTLKKADESKYKNIDFSIYGLKKREETEN